MDLRAVFATEVIGRHHPAQRRGECALRVGQEGRHARQRLLLFRIENMKDRADQQRMAGLLPMVAAFERALEIDQDVGDILDVADFVHAAPHFEQWVVARRAAIGRIEQQAMREARAPSGGQLPVLALDVVNDRRAGPTEQRRNHEANPLAGAGRRERHDMLGAVMAQVVGSHPSRHDTLCAEEPRRFQVGAGAPARRTVGRDIARLPRTPQRPSDRGGAADEAARRGDRARPVEDGGGIGLELEPPGEERPRAVDRMSPQHEPWRTELALIGELRGHPLRRRPDACDDDREHHEDLADKKLGGCHAEPLRPHPDMSACGQAPQSQNSDPGGTTLQGSHAAFVGPWGAERGFGRALSRAPSRPAPEGAALSVRGPRAHSEPAATKGRCRTSKPTAPGFGPAANARRRAASFGVRIFSWGAQQSIRTTTRDGSGVHGAGLAAPRAVNASACIAAIARIHDPTSGSSRASHRGS